MVTRWCSSTTCQVLNCQTHMGMEPRTALCLSSGLSGHAMTVANRQSPNQNPPFVLAGPAKHEPAMHSPSSPTTASQPAHPSPRRTRARLGPGLCAWRRGRRGPTADRGAKARWFGSASGVSVSVSVSSLSSRGGEGRGEPRAARPRQRANGRLTRCWVDRSRLIGGMRCEGLEIRRGRGARSVDGWLGMLPVQSRRFGMVSTRNVPVGAWWWSRVSVFDADGGLDGSRLFYFKLTPGGPCTVAVLRYASRLCKQTPDTQPVP